jgi:glycosyltransferase involved in cell wall biosynthesis
MLFQNKEYREQIISHHLSIGEQVLYYYMDFSVIYIKSVRNKIIEQAEAMIVNGIDVTIVISREDEKISRELALITNIKIIYLNKISNNNFIGLLEDFVDLLRFTAGLNKDDILYTRYAPQSFFMIPRNCIIITEHQTKESMEYEMKSLPSFIMEKSLGRINRGLRDYYVAVTEEISEFESSYGEAGHIVIPNGISLQNIQLISRKEAVSDEFHIVGLANVSSWHGYDRVIEGLNKYSGPVKVYFHIIGEGEEIINLKLLTKKYGLDDQVIYHGHKTGIELDKILNNFHIAVGALGIHRKRIKEAATLKSREYCARGIPFIEGSIDSDFKDFPYKYQIEADESPVDIERLIEFFNECAPNEYPRIMREYAEQNLAWDRKMKKLKTFLTEIRSKN